MTLTQFLSILKARRASALAVLSIIVASTVAVSLVLPKQYTATAAVLVDVKSPDPILGMMLGSAMMPGYMSTQVDIITSDRVARRVVRELRLTESAQLRQDWIDDTDGQGNFEAWIGELLQKKLDVKPSRESNVVNIAYKAPDGKFAAALANAFAKAYIDTSVELRVDPAKQYTSFFDARAKELRAALETAQIKLSEYQRQNGILVTDERLDIETQRLNELTSQLVAIQALSAESRSRTAQANARADQLQDVITNPVVAGLRSDLSRQEARLQELNAKLGDAHPQVQELKANIAELRQRIETETRRVSSSVGINNKINSSREADVRAALELQRTKVADLKQQRDDTAVLLKDVDTAQRAYDTVAQRLTQTSLESQTGLTNISVLTPATEPSLHSSPKLLLNTILSVFLGGLLAICFAFFRELKDQRVRSTTELSDVLGLPVLGSLPKPLGGKAGLATAAILLPNNVTERLPGPSR